MANTPTVQASGHSVAEWTWFSIGIAALVIFLCNLIMACCRRIQSRRGKKCVHLIAGEIKQFDDKFILELSQQLSTDWSKLALHLGFNHAELEALKVDNLRDVVEQCRQMLVAWQGKKTNSEPPMVELVKALNEIGRNDLALYLAGEMNVQIQLDDPAQGAFEKCKEVLQDLYRTTGSYVKILPWFGDDSMHIMDIYTNLELLMTNDDIAGKVESYEHIFHMKTREGDAVKRAILNGRAGLGKSTLLDKIAYDWACGSAELRKFKLVFVLQMHSLAQESDLIDALFDQLLDENDIDKDDLKSFIIANSDKVLFLLDGFDDFQTTKIEPTKFGSVLQMLNRKGEFKNCHVIVTTRPSHFDKVVQNVLIQKPFINVNVLGFKEKDTELYVNKFYSKHPRKSRELIEELQSSDTLSSLAKSPMLLLLMCILWRHDAKLPATMSRLYSDAMKYIFKRKHGNIADEGISDAVILIGKIAVDGLVSRIQRLTFTESEFGNSSAFVMSKDAGILTSERVVRGIRKHMSVQFIHKTFHEFCAAEHCKSLFQTDTGKFQEILKHIDDPCKNEFFLRFCCGDNEPGTNKILESLLAKGKGHDLNDEHVKLALNCYFESQCDKMPPLNINSVVLTENIFMQKCNSDHMISYMYLLKQVIDHTESRGDTYFTTVRKLTIGYTNLHRLGSDFAKYVSKMTNLTYLSIWNCFIKPEDVASSIADKASLTEFTIDKEALGGCAKCLSSGMKVLQHLQKVALTDCQFIAIDIEQIAASLCDVASLRELDLARNATLGGATESWFYITKLKQLTKLSLDSCSLTGEDIKHIAESLSDMPKLVELNLSRNVTLGGSDTPWSSSTKMKYFGIAQVRVCSPNLKECKYAAADMGKIGSGEFGKSCRKTRGGLRTKWCHLSEMKHVRTLNLGFCSLLGEDVKDIGGALSDMPNLVDLDLSYNVALCGSGESLSHLSKMNSVRNLKLRFCSLTGEDMLYIAAAVGEMPNLVELDLSENDDLRGSGETWYHLAKMKHLRKLYLVSCSLTGEDIMFIAVSLCEASALIELDLSRNDVSWSLGESWSNLPLMQHLKKLKLGFCSMTAKHLKHLAEALSSMPNLVELDLSHNETLGCAGESWSHLTKMKYLKKLDLKSCRLMGPGVKQVSEAVSSMSNLEELGMSFDEILVSNEPWPHLRRMKHLKKLNLDALSIKGSEILLTSLLFSR